MRAVEAELVHGDTPVQEVTFARDSRNRARRPFSVELLVVARVGKEVHLLWLPRLQALEQSFVDMSRLGDLRRENGRISSQIEGFGCDHTRGLVVAMVFADKKSRKPSENYVRPGETDDTDNIFQGGSMMLVRQRLQHILARRIAPAQKPHVLDAKLSEGVTQLHLAHGTQRHGAFTAHVVVPGFSAC